MNVSQLQQFKCADFNVKDSVYPERPKKCENEKLKKLVDNDLTQTQRELAKVFHVSQKYNQQTFMSNGRD